MRGNLGMGEGGTTGVGAGVQGLGIWPSAKFQVKMSSSGLQMVVETTVGDWYWLEKVMISESYGSVVVE